METDRLFAE